jgi:hypothetical protein
VLTDRVVAIAATTRVAHVHEVAAVVGISAIPATIATLHGGDPGFGVLLVLVVAASSVALGVDDPAADLLGAAPIGSPWRTWARLATTAAGASTTSAVVVATVESTSGHSVLPGHRLAEIAGITAIAVAAALVAARHGEQRPGSIGLICGVLGTAVIAVLSFRWPHLVPGLDDGPAHDRWWLIAGLGVAVAAHAGRDPGRPVLLLALRRRRDQDQRSSYIS